MKLRSPFLIRLAAFLTAILIRLLSLSVRRRVLVCDGLTHPADWRSQRYLYAFWHEDILLSTTFRARIRVMISEHADGEFIARTARHLGKGTVRGSSSRGGRRAMLQLIRRCPRDHLGITPDGPRGPRRRVQPGIVFLAAQTGLPIVPFGVGYSRAWRARSWDRFAIVCPGAAVTYVVSPPIHVPADISRSQLETYRLLIEERMHWVSDLAERLVHSKQLSAEQTVRAFAAQFRERDAMPVSPRPVAA